MCCHVCVCVCVCVCVRVQAQADAYSAFFSAVYNEPWFAGVRPWPFFAFPSCFPNTWRGGVPGAAVGPRAPQHLAARPQGCFAPGLRRLQPRALRLTQHKTSICLSACRVLPA